MPTGHGAAASRPGPSGQSRAHALAAGRMPSCAAPGASHSHRPNRPPPPARSLARGLVAEHPGSFHGPGMGQGDGRRSAPSRNRRSLHPSPAAPAGACRSHGVPPRRASQTKNTPCTEVHRHFDACVCRSACSCQVMGRPSARGRQASPPSAHLCKGSARPACPSRSDDIALAAPVLIGHTMVHATFQRRPCRHTMRSE